MEEESFVEESVVVMKTNDEILIDIDDYDNDEDICEIEVISSSVEHNKLGSATRQLISPHIQPPINRLSTSPTIQPHNNQPIPRQVTNGADNVPTPSPPMVIVTEAALIDFKIEPTDDDSPALEDSPPQSPSMVNNETEQYSAFQDSQDGSLTRLESQPLANQITKALQTINQILQPNLDQTTKSDSTTAKELSLEADDLPTILPHPGQQITMKSMPVPAYRPLRRQTTTTTTARTPAATKRKLCQPFLRIVEQPQDNGLRFRYRCEGNGKSAGSLKGVSSTEENKTYPTVEIVNYRGPAMIVASCVTMDHPHLTHPHNLVGPHCDKGVCTVLIDNEDMRATFTNLGIQCVKKKEVEPELSKRKLLRVDPFGQGFAHKKGNVHNAIDLNVVRICFQAFIEGPTEKFTEILAPVVSVPIWDTKSTKGVQIIEMSDDWSPVDGGKKMIILCERILKSDIKVNFFETDKSGNRTWEAGGIFEETDVHKQYGICFRTPPYRTDRSITTKVRVNVELQKLSDKHGRSDPLPFYYFPKTCSCLSPTTGRAYLPPPSDNCLPTCGRRGLQPRREDNVAQ